MKIISKFHDYYDSAMAYGIDASVVYERNTMEFERGWDKAYRQKVGFPPKIEELYDFILSRTTEKDDYLYRSKIPSKIQFKKHSFDLETFLVVFCGTIHKGIYLNGWNGDRYEERTDEYFYDLESLDKFVKKYNYDLSSKKVEHWSNNQKLDKAFSEYFNNVKNTQESQDYFIENKVTSTVIIGNKVVINPKLKDYQFYKLHDPFQAYQKLDMWVSGTLSYPHNFMIEIEDKYKVESHGFDKKYGFRTRPKSK